MNVIRIDTYVKIRQIRGLDFVDIIPNPAL
jgi:hypothetical protein